jgi:hypothetical protein
MFLHNTKYTFPLPTGSPGNLAGGVVLASAMSMPELLDRPLTDRAAYLSRHRMFDPQVYFADITTDTAKKTASYLGSYPWFDCLPAPYTRVKNKKGQTWFRQHQRAVANKWTGRTPTSPTEIRECVTAAIRFQLDYGCHAIILPAPMTRDVALFAREVRWLDIGLEVCASLQVTKPIYATIALDDFIVRQRRPLESLFLQSIAANIVQHRELAGAYIVLAQEAEQPNGYVCRAPDSVLAMLSLVHDIAHLAGRDVIVNGFGPASIMAVAAGASAWLSSFYRSARRVRTSDCDDRDSMATNMPRYFSTALLGDIGVRADLAWLAKHPQTRALLTDTPPARGVNAALLADPQTVVPPTWRYRAGTPTASMAHFLWCMQQLDTTVTSVAPNARPAVVADLLAAAATHAEVARQVLTSAPHYTAAKQYTDLLHQRTWRDAFTEWRTATGR